MSYKQILQSVLIAGLFLNPLSINAQRSLRECECHLLISQDIERITYKDERNETYKHFFCLFEEETVFDLLSRRQDLRLLIPEEFAFSGNLDDRRKFLREWKLSYCKTEDSTDSDKTEYQKVTKYLSPEANKCYNQCLNARGLLCQLIPLNSVNYVVFNANWIPTGNDLTFPKITNLNIAGGSQVETQGDNTSPLTVGKDINVTGISALLNRQSDRDSLSVVLQTDKGSCSPSLDPVPFSYKVVANINGQGRQLVEVRKESGIYDFRNDKRCDENSSYGSVPVCLDTDAVAIRHEGPFVHSARNSRAWIDLKKPTDNCMTINTWYRDSGYTKLGACKGHGWITVSAIVIGQKYIPWTSGPVSIPPKNLSVRAGSRTQEVFDFPVEKITNTSDRKWNYSLTISRLDNRGSPVETVNLGTNSNKLGPFSSSIDESGQLTLIIEP